MICRNISPPTLDLNVSNPTQSPTEKPNPNLDQFDVFLDEAGCIEDDDDIIADANPQPIASLPPKLETARMTLDDEIEGLFGVGCED